MVKHSKKNAKRDGTGNSTVAQFPAVFKWYDRRSFNKPVGQVSKKYQSY
jgi:hypothetical protein